MRFSETANRQLEQLDILFASKSCLAWKAEREFREKTSGGEGVEGLSKQLAV